MSTELVEIAKVNIRVTESIITSNLKEVKARLDKELEGLLDKKITKEELPKAKKSLADARKIYLEIDKKRKSIKREILKPYDNIEVEFENATESLTKYANNLKKQIEVFEKEETEKKLAKIQEIIDERLEKEPQSTKDFIKKISWFEDSKWANKTISFKKITEQVDASVTQISNDLIVLSQQPDEIYGALLEEYRRNGMITNALILKDRLLAEIEQTKRMKEEAERQYALEQERRKQEAIKKPVQEPEVEMPIINDPVVEKPIEEPEVEMPIENDPHELFEDYQSVPLTNDNWQEPPKEIIRLPEDGEIEELPKVEYRNEKDKIVVKATYEITADIATIRFIKELSEKNGAIFNRTTTPVRA